jgi:hypothetical protein
VIKRLLHLIGWFLITWIAAGAFVFATPPGGVAWPYYFVLLLIPLTVFRYAHRLSLAICYGLVSGFFFAWPVFTDGRTEIRIAFGDQSGLEIGIQIISFMFTVTCVCILSFYLRRFRPTSSRRATNPA